MAGHCLVDLSSAPSLLFVCFLMTSVNLKYLFCICLISKKWMFLEGRMLFFLHSLNPSHSLMHHIYSLNEQIMNDSIEFPPVSMSVMWWWSILEAWLCKLHVRAEQEASSWRLRGAPASQSMTHHLLRFLSLSRKGQNVIFLFPLRVCAIGFLLRKRLYIVSSFELDHVSKFFPITKKYKDENCYIAI